MSENLENKATRGSISQIILKALTSGDKYGYEIIKNIENLTDGKLILKQPSLYSCLRRMEEQNLISSYWKDSDIGGNRHYYSLTEKGREYLEETKHNWSNDEELLNNLPLNEKDENDESFDFAEESTKGTVVLNQENLFNLNRLNKEIKKIDAAAEASETDENKSFFQFDFFEQNIKFVKENSKSKQELSAFSNKFSDMDNQGVEIEPEKRESISPYIKQEKQKLNENNKIDVVSSNCSAETKQNTSQNHHSPILKSHKSISRNDVFSNNEDSTLDRNLVNSEIIYPEQNLNFSEQDNKEDYNLAQELNYSLDSKTSTNNSELIPNNSNPYLSTDIEPIIEKNSIKQSETISWDFETEYSNENALFSENDYKSVIGKLYNNSRLEDPYEKNKFQTFKEIFPHSQFKDEQTSEKTGIESNIDQKERLTQILKSSEESNIDCEDIKKLNSLYNLQGIQIKVHSNQENKKQTKKYTDKNKINMVCSWIVSSIMILELLFSYFILKSNSLYTRGSSLIYFLGIAITLSYCIISTFENIFDRFRLIIIEKSFKKSFLQRIFAFILIIIAIFALNLVFGMTSLTEINYLSFWLVPTLLATNLPISSIVYFILLKSKLYNS